MENEPTSTDDGSTTTDTIPAPADPLGSNGGGSASIVLDPTADQSESSSSKKLPSSKYKGVVPQPNGRWGAQIYEKHNRIWLGTFTDEHHAARSYDVAAHRFRGSDAVLNFSPLTDASEISFLSSRSKTEIVDMLRKHTYSHEFRQATPLKITPNSGAKIRLFEKTVTPSDVGKLNRLVIPKQHAEKHFPIESEGNWKGVLLNMEDANGKVWRFRYSYWNSSQSYVLTKGWSRFVKEMRLKAGDTVVFLRAAEAVEAHQLYIECRSSRVGEETTSSGGVRVTSSVLMLFGVEIKSEVDGNGNGKRGIGNDVVVDLELGLGLDYSNHKRMRMLTAQFS